MKPTKTIIPVAIALANWRDPYLQYSVKMDGRFATRPVNNYTVAGELMRDGAFIAFDVLDNGSRSVRDWALRERWGLLVGLQAELTRLDYPVVNTDENGADLLARVLAAGGEGVCAKRWDDSYGAGMLAAKRVEDFVCKVTGFVDGSQSVRIADLATGEPRGHVALRAGKCDQVRLGSVLKLNGYGLTERGLIREPRTDSDSCDSWLVKF